MPRQQTICRYFAYGMCSKGNTCSFAHDVATRNEKICQFNLMGKCSYGQACRFKHTRPTNDERPTTSMAEKPNAVSLAELCLCPYHQIRGDCNMRNGDGCPFEHGDHCDMCNQWSLHPSNQEQRRQHRKECLISQSQKVERASLVQKTETKKCEICKELIFKKNRRFGILNRCSHCFCLDCIRQRRSEDGESAKRCPVCREHSDYIVPSFFWVEKGEEKDLLIAMYMDKMKSKVCKYYSDTRPKESCKFGNKCFYKHQRPDGSIDPGEPSTSRNAFMDNLVSGIDESERNRQIANFIRLFATPNVGLPDDELIFN